MTTIILLLMILALLGADALGYSPTTILRTLATLIVAGARKCASAWKTWRAHRADQ